MRGFAAAARKCLWVKVLSLTGGFTVVGQLPPGGCVVVANHSSHADSSALLAGVPATHQPVVAAAADHWFASPVRALLCRALVGGFPVRRGGGGGDDLMSAAGFLQEGRAVVIYPEGTRTRTGEVGEFHRCAFRLATAAGVPVVPAAITGTRRLLPITGPGRRSSVTVRFGAPLTQPTAAEARAAVLAMLPPAGPVLRGTPVRHAPAAAPRSSCGRHHAVIEPGHAERMDEPVSPPQVKRGGAEGTRTPDPHTASLTGQHPQTSVCVELSLFAGDLDISGRMRKPADASQLQPQLHR